MDSRFLFLSLLLNCVKLSLSLSCDQPYKCPDLKCPYGFQTDEHNCNICQCKFSCPDNNCKIMCDNGYELDTAGCPLCECKKPQCPKFNCSKVCIDGYAEIDGCPYCECKVIPCPMLNCERCPSGFQRNLRGCQTCECTQICPPYRCRLLCGSPKKNENFISACGCKCWAQASLYSMRQQS